MPGCDASSGEIGASSPVSASRRRATDGTGVASIRRSSSAMRSPDRCATSAARVDPGERLRLDPEAERRRETDGAEHPERVFLEPRPRVADRPQQPTAEVALAAVRVDETGCVTGGGPPGDGVDGQVAPVQVSIDRVGELDAVRPPVVGIGMVGAQRRDLDIPTTGSSVSTATVPKAFS